jgi:hypothetical protein
LAAIATLGLCAREATAQNIGVCAARADGVPYEPGPPAWRDFSGGGASGCGGAGINCNFDDPRWRGATAMTYNSASGSANPPVQFRTAWHQSGADRYLLLQWVIRIGVTGARGNAHDLFVGFERPNASTLTAGHQRAFVAKIHLYRAETDTVTQLDPTSGATDARIPTLCTTLPSTDCDPATDFYAIYQNFQGAGGVPNGAGETCSSISGDPYRFDFVGGPAGSAGNPTWLANSIQYERRCAGTTAGTCNTWVVSMRVPVIAPDPAKPTVSDLGIEDGSKFWYQLDLGAYDPGTGSIDAKIDSWPRNDAATVAGPGFQDAWCATSDPAVYYKDVDSDNGSGMGMGPEPWANLYLWNNIPSSRPSDCFSGLSITPDDIGDLARAFGSSAPASDTVLSSGLERLFKAFTSGTNRATNAVIARPKNNSGVDVTAQIRARFRLAQWGIQPWGAAGSSATWSEIPGQRPGGECATDRLVCNDGSTCSTLGAACPDTSTCHHDTVCGMVTISGTDNLATPYDDRKTVIQFDWPVGGTTDPINAAGALEYCQYGITPPAASGFTCEDCPINPPTSCDPVAAPSSCGTRLTGTTSCTRKLWDHQCMYVELDSDSSVNFETSSVYTNMNVRPMSEVAREATISVRGLPPIPGAQNENIYLVVMPRNMPSSLPSGTTGTSLVQSRAAAQRNSLMRPFVQAARRMTDEQYREAAHAGYGGISYGGDSFDPVIIEPPGQDFPAPELPRGVDLMPRDLRAVAGFLDSASHYGGSAEALTNQTLDTLDDITATTLVPTLDVYAFRLGPNKRLIPLTSFTLVVHHEGPLTGITWQIDGASRISTNLFRVDMPVGHKRNIQVRVMAHEGNEPQAPGDREWPCKPCAGCCCNHKTCSATERDLAINNGLPLFFVGAVFMARGRRRKK